MGEIMKHEINIKDFENYVADLTIASGSAKNGTIKKICLRVDVDTNYVKYEVRISDKSKGTKGMWSTLKEAIEVYNEL